MTSNLPLHLSILLGTSYFFALPCFSGNSWRKENLVCHFYITITVALFFFFLGFMFVYRYRFGYRKKTRNLRCNVWNGVCGTGWDEAEISEEKRLSFSLNEAKALKRYRSFSEPPGPEGWIFLCSSPSQIPAPTYVAAGWACDSQIAAGWAPLRLKFEALSQNFRSRLGIACDLGAGWSCGRGCDPTR